VWQSQARISTTAAEKRRLIGFKKGMLRSFVLYLFFGVPYSGLFALVLILRK